MAHVALALSAIVFLFVALMHGLRLVFRVKVVIGNYLVPVWFSLIGSLFALCLSLFIFASMK